MAGTVNIPTEKIGEFFKNLPGTLKSAPVDEQAAYGAIGLGIVLVIVSVIILIL